MSTRATDRDYHEPGSIDYGYNPGVDLVVSKAVRPDEREVTCPAGVPYTDRAVIPACFCRIEGRPVLSSTQPHSFVKHCTGRYTTCPTWQADNPR